MNPRKTTSWHVCLLVLLAVAAFGASLRAAPEPVDPIVGNWLWHRDSPVTFKADGTVHHSAGFDGTWDYLYNPEVQRHYRIVWEHGKNIDEAICTENCQNANVRNNRLGLQFKARRAMPDKPAASPTPAPSVAPERTTAAVVRPAAVDLVDPIIGEWQWGKGNTVTFQADGTMTTAAGMQGVWMFLRNPEASRKYVLDWRYGAYTDHLTYNRAARTGHVVNQLGDQWNVTQGAAVPGTPANYFGAPGR